jgi:hypothetical protein
MVIFRRKSDTLMSPNRLAAGADCSLPDNFIYFTGSSKNSEAEDMEGDLVLKIATLLEVCLSDIRPPKAGMQS